MSGPVVSSYTTWDKRPGLYCRRLASELGCSQTDVKEVAECMRSLPVLSLPEKTQMFLHHQGRDSPNSWQVFRTISLHVSITFFLCFPKLEGI
jgi:hypothetical protein